MSGRDHRRARIAVHAAAALGLLLCLAATGAATAAAATAPGEGRWVGVRKDGMDVSFVVQALADGRRFIAGEVWRCSGEVGGPAGSTDTLDYASYAWPIDRRGSIRDLAGGAHRTSALAGRLGGSAGSVRLSGQIGACSASKRVSFRVRRVETWLPQDGIWELSEERYGSSVRFGVLGAAMIVQANGSLNAPRAQGPWPDSGGRLCIRSGHGVLHDSWIAPTGSFADAGEAGFAITGEFFTSWRADGSFRARWRDPACSSEPVSFCVRLVEAQPRARANRLRLPAQSPRRRACPAQRLRTDSCCL